MFQTLAHYIDQTYQTDYKILVNPIGEYFLKVQYPDGMFAQPQFKSYEEAATYMFYLIRSFAATDVDIEDVKEELAHSNHHYWEEENGNFVLKDNRI